MKRAGLVLGPALFLLILLWAHPPGLSEQGCAVLAITVWVAVWWITEALPLPVTSLLPIILMPLTGVAKIEETTRAYADPMIFLFVGGFIMAIAMEKWNLHRRIALNILKLLGTKSDRIVLGFILATGSISMWISNTATAAMMLPTGIALISQIPDDLSGGQQKANFAKAIMLSIAYAASIGGVATLVGTPTNVIFAGMVKDLIGVEVSFVKWMAFGIPSVVILLFLCWLLLTKFLFPLKNYTLPGSHSEIKKQLQELGKMSWEEKWILAVFSVVAFAWITRSYLLKSIVPGLDDPMIALLGAIALFLIPSKSKPGAMLLDWKSAERLSWGILFLYGGGLALAEGFKISGLSDWLGTQLTYLSGMPYWAILLIVMFFVVALTEIASNVATVAMMMPILGALGQALHLDPFGLMVAATIAASCGFMMPAGTAPNAIVFGSGHLRIVDMVKAGFWLDVLAALFFAGVAYWIVPLLWG